MILGMDGIGLGVRPHVPIARSVQRDVDHVETVGERVGQHVDEPPRQVLVEQQPHAGVANRRSRSAAKANAARTWASVSSGKSATMSAVDMPAARYSRTSYTVIRVPTKHGLPLRTPGRTSINLSSFTTAQSTAGRPPRGQSPSAPAADRLRAEPVHPRRLDGYLHTEGGYKIPADLQTFCKRTHQQCPVPGSTNRARESGETISDQVIYEPYDTAWYGTKATFFDS